MVWFNYLKERGYFNPDGNPAPVATDKGFYIPRWESLDYLERAAERFKETEIPEIIDEIIAIIRDVSQKPQDNYSTWYRMMQLLEGMPNEKIPADIFEYIPVWFTSRFDTMLQSDKLCGGLLVKFLPAEPTHGDIEKAEVILKHLFTLKKVKDSNHLAVSESETYASVFYLHHLKAAFQNNALIGQIARYCSFAVIDNLMGKMRLLVLDSPFLRGFTFKSEEKKYNLVIKIEDEALMVILEEENVTDPLETLALRDYYDIPVNGVKAVFEQLLIKHRIDLELNENSISFDRLLFNLYNDLYSVFMQHPVNRLDDEGYVREDSTVDVFAFALRELLTAKVNAFPALTNDYLHSALGAMKYNLPFFKRIFLYAIAENWDSQKGLFWEMVQNGDELHYFSSGMYQHELYYLLDKNQTLLTAEEVEKLVAIIEQGPQENHEYAGDNYANQWKHRWYAALKDIPIFKSLYNSLSIQINLAEKDYANEGKATVIIGSVSPFTVDEILAMPHEGLLSQLLNYNGSEQWGGPSVDGFATNLGKAVETSPAGFPQLIKDHPEIPDIYIYHALLGFSEAWKNHKPFDWEKILFFCHSYLLNRAKNGLTKISGWVSGYIGYLITQGTRDDNNAFPSALLPIAKNILLLLIKELQPDSRFEKGNMDYPMYSLNSTAGKVLRAALDYSLRKVRVGQITVDKWEQDIKEAFESTFQKNIIDGYIIQGMYFEQFLFLDEAWITEAAKSYYNLEGVWWEAFLNGLMFGRPPGTAAIYKLMLPHYVKAVKNNTGFSKYYSYGIIRHITSLYFWGFEPLADDSLISLSLNSWNAEHINELIFFIRIQRDYFKGLSQAEALDLQNKIFALWEYLADFSDKSAGDKHDLKASLIYLVPFITVLDDRQVGLVLKSSPLVEQRQLLHVVLEELTRLIESPSYHKKAFFIGKIAGSIPFKEYIYPPDSEAISALVLFLYNNNEKAVADSICNRIALSGNEFLKDIYLQFNK